MRRKTILIVDGYNMIGAWPELAYLKKNEEIQAARDLLLFELSNYKKYRGYDIIVVFDAQLVPGITQTYDQYDVRVVFTSEGETADTYIERVVKYYVNALTRVVVATSDQAEQWMVFQHGALRQSAQELLMDINLAKQQINIDVRDYYSTIQRRNSPWSVRDLALLDQLRHHISRDS